MTTEILSDEDARKKLASGANQLAEAVAATLGAKGRTVVIKEKHLVVQVTKDGVTVAKKVKLKDKIEATGAEIILQAATKTVELAGDGTTTATLLAQSLINAGLKAIEQGAAPIDIKAGIDKAVLMVTEAIKKVSTEVKDNETIERIATISANNDNFIGRLIRQAYEAVGREGFIVPGDSATGITEVEIVEGQKIDRGYMSPNFVTNPDKMVCELVNPYIFITDSTITDMREIIPILNQVADQNRPILFIAEDINREPLATLVINKIQGVLKVCAIKCPGYGDMRTELMEDIAVFTGGTFVSQSIGAKLENVTIQQLGRAEKIKITNDSCLIIGGAGDKDLVETRCNQLKEQRDQAASQIAKDRLTERISKLKSGVAIIKAGGQTEIEVGERRDRIDDALRATTAAIEEGYVCGGGATFVNIAPFINIHTESEDERIGINIVKKAIAEPFRRILTNGDISPDRYMHEVQQFGYGFGYNMKTNTVENLIDAGVIDPAKVLRVALENAASVAGIFLTTACVICENDETTRG